MERNLEAPWIRDRNCFSSRFHVDPAKRERFELTFDQMCSTAEPYYRRGCAFAFQGWARDPNEFVVLASWDEGVVQELRADPEFKRLTAALMDCCDGPMIMEQFSGKDIDRGIFEAYPAGGSAVHQPGEALGAIFK